MKRWMKGMLIVALGFILVGGVAAGICLALGASWADTAIVARNSGWGFSEPRTWDFANQNIYEIEMETGTGEVIWQTGDHFRVEMTGSGPNYDCDVQNGVLKIEEKGSSGSWIFNWIVDHNGIHNSHRVITVTVPEDEVLRKVDISVGTGSLEADSILADEAYIQVEVGEFTCDNLNVSGTAELEVDVGSIAVDSGRAAEALNVEAGVGSAVLNEFVSGPASMSADTGSVAYSGTIRGDWEARCDLGSVALFLDGTQENYNYIIECDLGDVEIGDLSYSSLSGSRQIENGAAYTADLSCDLGSIELSFAR